MPANPLEAPPPALWRCAAAGGLGGLLSGMFGVGGGVVMVPLLIWLAGLDQRRASATSLAAIIPTAAVGALTYGARGHLAPVTAAIVAAGASLGAWAGARVLRRVKLGVLSWAFVALLAATAAFMVLYTPGRAAALPLDAARGLGLAGLGLAMGLAAGLFGIGGGVIAVPALMALFGAGDLVARGTSLLVMVPSAVTGSVTNWRGGLVAPKAGLATGLAAAAASFAGAGLAFLVSPRLGNTLFAALLALAAVQLALRAPRRPPHSPPGNPPGRGS
ncbi:MAG: sulfite exporter TauE/SafE family protein [Bifidobacteriaceae bacterium]|nr:sulfite exporter TauE/SafE family protein [Bifidobacteriaceae bacterium]